MEFGDLINSPTVELRKQSEEAQFSFLQGAYVDGFDSQGRYIYFTFLFPLLFKAFYEQTGLRSLERKYDIMQ